MKSQTISAILLALLLAGMLAMIPILELADTTLFTRTPGKGNPFVTNSIAACGGNDRSTFKIKRCSKFINCVYTQLTEVRKTDSSTGATLLGLLPTINLLIAPSPLALVQQGLVAPHRALSTAAFSIGMPINLSSRLRPVRHRFWNSVGLAEERRIEWVVTFAVLSLTNHWVQVAGKAAADLIIVCLFGVMLWRSFVLNMALMVTWKCESPIITFAWTIGCIAWLITALLLIHAMKEDIRFEHLTDDTITYTWWEVLLLPYTLNFDRKLNTDVEQGTRSTTPHEARFAPLQGQRETGTSSGATNPGSAAPAHPLSSQNCPPSSPAPADSHAIRIVVIMPQESGFKSLAFYESVLDLLGAGVYFYGTFALVSVVFMPSVKAIHHISITVSVYTAIRVISGIF